MDRFGNVRDISKRESFESFSMATGTQANLATAQRNLTIANVLMSSLIDERTKLVNQREAIRSALVGYGRDRNNCPAPSMWNKNHAVCTEPLDALIIKRNGEFTQKTQQITAKNTEISNQRVVLDNLDGSIDQLTQAIAEEAQAEATLAGQGMTSESVAINAKAQADAIKAQAQSDADALLQASEQKAKTRKLIILGSVLLALAIAGFFAFRAIKAKKFGKKK